MPFRNPLTKLLIVGSPGGSNVSILPQLTAPLLAFYGAIIPTIARFEINMSPGDGSYYYQIVGIQTGNGSTYRAGWVSVAGKVREFFNNEFPTIGAGSIQQFGGAGSQTDWDFWTFGTAWGQLQSPNNTMEIYGTDVRFGPDAPPNGRDTGSVNIFNDLKYRDISQGRGVLSDQDINGTFTSTAGVETTVITTPSLVFVSERAYRFSVDCLIQGSVVSIPTAFRIRVGVGTGGTNKIFKGNYSTLAASANVPVNFSKVLVNNTGADVTQQMTLTIIGSALGNVSVVGATTSIGELLIEDVGSTAQFATTTRVI